MYWPSKQAKSEVHGPIRITHLDEESFSHYIVRRFEIKPTDHSTHYSQVGLLQHFDSRHFTAKDAKGRDEKSFNNSIFEGFKEQFVASQSTVGVIHRLKR